MVHRGDHSSSPGIATGIQQPTRGFSSTMAFATANGACFLSKTRSASRAGSPLLFGLAPRGVFRASGVATGAVGSYPTFSPLPTMQACEDVAQVYLRDATVLDRRRFIFCGTFRERIRKTQPKRLCYWSAPLALPGALPIIVTGSCEPTTRVSGLSSRPS